MERPPRTAWPLAALSLALALGPGAPRAAEPAPAATPAPASGSTPAPASAGAGVPIVSDVRVEGNRRVEADAVKAAVTKKGAPLDPRKIDADVRALMKLGFFSDVVAEIEGDPERPVLVFRVVERPIVKEANVVGNEALSKDDLKDVAEVKPGSMLDLVAVKKDVKKLQEKYVEKGYFLAEVTYRIDKVGDNEVAVRYVADEKAKVQVREIRFVGNRKLSRATLLATMMTKEGNILSFINGAGTYREDMFQRDISALNGAYLDQGYVNAKIGKPSIALSPDRRYLYLTIPVEEGEQYSVGKIEFSGDLLGEEARLHRVMQTQPGAIFSRSRIGDDLFAFSDVYKDRGYAYANVTPLTTPDAARRILDVNFEVQTGPKCRFERIEIVGNDKTRDKVIRRELRIYEGETFNGTAIKTSKARVTALGFFDTVEITTKKGSAEDLVVATVEVKEKPTGTFQLGAGYSSYESFILTGQVSQQNFFGWGQTLSLQVQWSAIMQLGQIQFVEPYFLDTSWTYSVDLYANEAYYMTFTRSAMGGDMTWGYELSGLAKYIPWTANLEDMRIFLTYTNEYVTSIPTGLMTSLYNEFRSGTTSSLRLSFQWDKRDNRLFPTAGFFISATAEVAPPALAPSFLYGQEVNLFTRYTLDARFYKPLFAGIVARGKLTLGLIQDWDPSRPVPISEYYYIGGIYTVRGYPFLSIAAQTPVPINARDPSSPLMLVPTGGNKEAIINLELEFPILPSAGIKGVLFADAGNTFAPGAWRDPTVSWSLYKSVGFGFRWFSPIGPLRFEWGIPLDRRTDPVTGAYIDQAVDFELTIGNFF